MFYEFPIITNIQDVLPAIQDSPEFIVAEKEGYMVVNYMVNMENTFPPINTVRLTNGDVITEPIYETKADGFAAIRRECRGSKYDSETGRIIARPYHKFFNVGERAEVMLPQIDLTQPHVMLEKLDGSMIHPMIVNGSIRWCTKMGITDTSMQAEEFVARNTKYTEFAIYCLNGGHTPIFEWCSNKNRIVLDYPEDQLILTAVRHMITGEYQDLWNIDNNTKN